MAAHIVSLPPDPREKRDVLLYPVDCGRPGGGERGKMLIRMHTFIFLQRGTKKVTTPYRTELVTDLDLLILRPCDCISVEYMDLPGVKERSLVLQVSEKAILDVFRKAKVVLEGKGANNYCLKVSDPDFMQPYISSLSFLETVSNGKTGGILKAKLEELLLYLLETHGVDALEFLVQGPEQQDSPLLNIVEQNKFNRVSIKELASMANMSVSSFKREFEKHYHTTPGKWFQNQRLEYAAYLLHHTSRRPSDVYLEVGYASLAHFINAFKTKFGVTPGQYLAEQD